MTSGSSLILDTNAVICLLNQPSEIAHLLHSDTQPVLPFAALAELEIGASNSSRVSENSKRIELLLTEIPLLLPDRVTCRIYGTIAASLRRMGRPIPANDMWIAALGLQHDLPVVTRDTHFREVPELRIRSW